MPTSHESSRLRTSRRQMLTGIALGGTASVSGCLQRTRSILNWDGASPASLTIATVQSDSDRESIRIARILRDTFESIGISTDLSVLGAREFTRQVYVNHRFDLFVDRLFDPANPDSLFERCHSRFSDESGRQNPFGYTNAGFDDAIDAMRVSDDANRSELIQEVLVRFLEEIPFIPVCRQRELRLARSDRFDGWSDDHLDTSYGYLGITPLEDDDSMTLVSTDPRLTENMNPFAIEYRHQGIYTGFIYDTLARSEGPELHPWLARSWEWEDSRLVVSLRSDQTFHDGNDVTASDVAFTYKFLADTTMGEGSTPVPATRYRALGSSVTDVDILDESTLSLEFETGRPSAERALMIPVLPEHVWSERTDAATVGRIISAEGMTEAFATDNFPPIGSGPFEYDGHSVRERLHLRRNDDHFSLADPDLPGPSIEELTVRIAPRGAAAIELVSAGGADVTGSPLESYLLPDLDVPSGVHVRETVGSKRYFIGFNHRKAPFSNPYFRRTIARSVDKSTIVDEVFKGYADALASPLSPTWTPSAYVWDDGDPSYPLFESAGSFDPQAARASLEDAGFRFDGDGKLLISQ